MPRMTAFRKWQYRARLFNYRQLPVPGSNPPTTVPEYFFHRDIQLDIAQGFFGKITAILPDSSEDVMQNSRLLELRDRDGKEIYPGGVWTLGEIMPIFYMGRREGFRAAVTLTASTAAA